MSKPINISFNGGNNPLFTQYIYKLTVYHNNISSVFEESTTEKYITILTNKHNIMFDSIKCYELNVTVLSFGTEYYNIKNMFNIDDINVHKDNNIYIEFLKNKDDTTNCCIYLTTDNSRIFFTPPNY
jgi:hypothetical protein